MVSDSDADSRYSASQEAELVLCTNVDICGTSGARHALQPSMTLKLWVLDRMNPSKTESRYLPGGLHRRV